MNFLAIVLVLFFSHGGPAPRCAHVFAKGATLNQIPRVGAQEVPYETSELSRHGTVLNVLNSKQLAEYKETLLSRDGLYVFLLDRAGAIVIDHHLPLPIDYSKASFHGTHRGLLRAHEQNVSPLEKTEIVFAGELMVVGSQVVWVSDGSGYYYDTPKVPQRPGETARDYRMRTERDNENLRRLAKNRLAIVQNLLSSWGWIDASTKIKQSEESSGEMDHSSRQWEHRRSQQQALFERACRIQSQCWDFYLNMQSQVRRLTEVHGLELSKEKVQLLVRIDSQKTAVLGQLLSIIRESGVMGILYQKVDLQTGEPQQILREFMMTLDWYESVLQTGH